MGSWLDFLKKLPKPKGIAIEPSGKKLKVTLHYGGIGKDKEIIIDKTVLFSLDGINVEVEKGEIWGDWGGAIKIGDVLYIHKKEKEPINPEKVVFS